MTENIITNLGTTLGAKTIKKGFKLLSENIGGLQTNLGELTHSFVLSHKPDIFAIVETFLKESVPQSFGMRGL